MFRTRFTVLDVALTGQRKASVVLNMCTV
jgi:hypothetical protein